MSRRSNPLLRVGMPLALVVLAALGLEAGGWVVITVKDMPDHIVAGTPVLLTYAVRQHGVTLLNDLSGTVQASAGGQVVHARATALADRGHYSVTLNLPNPGHWTVVIHSGFGGQFDASRITVPVIPPGAPAPALSEADRGKRLFAAKGCVACHVHSAVDGPSTAVGPALTTKRFQPEYLKGFLAHPPAPAERDASRMPDLQLRDGEIQSLVAFINGPSTKGRPTAALNR